MLAEATVAVRNAPAFFWKKAFQHSGQIMKSKIFLRTIEKYFFLSRFVGKGFGDCQCNLLL